MNLVILSLLSTGMLSLTACSPATKLQNFMPGTHKATRNTAQGNAIGGLPAESNANQSGAADVHGTGPGTQMVSFKGTPFGGESFDPNGLFDFYDDDIFVTESGDTVYVTWESYVHGDEIYTSIAKGGNWVVRDKPVYSLTSLSKDGDWSRYLAGNELAVVNRLTDKSFMVLWDDSGTLKKQQALYKGWVGGDFPIAVDGAWGVTLHLPYGAPKGGARYDLFLPAQPAKPQVVTISSAQFTGALYALDSGQSRLYEVQTTKAGDHVLDVYTMGKPSSGSNSTQVPVNTSLVTNSNGQPLQHKLTNVPDILEVSPQGTVYTLTRDTQNRTLVTVSAYNANLQQVGQWTNVKLANPYVQNVQLGVSSGTPHIYSVVNYQGQAALQQIKLK